MPDEISQSPSVLKKSKGKNWLQKQPVFVVLLPLFFVVHGMLENLGFIRLADACWLLFICIACAAILYGICWRLFRSTQKTAIFTGFILFFFLFFGAIADFLKAHLHFLSKYSVLLPLFALVSVILCVYLRKVASVSKAVLFFNVLLLLYLLVDFGAICFRLLKNASHPAMSSDAITVNTFQSNTHFAKPDIYLLVLDEYGASDILRQLYGFDNPLDSFLSGRGFHLMNRTRSNYNYTWWSIASMMNMSYMKEADPSHNQGVRDINIALSLLKKCHVVEYLANKGYHFVNYSPFNFAAAPSLTGEMLLPVGTRLITHKTLFSRIYSDLGWTLIDSKFNLSFLFYKQSRDNEMLQELTAEYSGTHHEQPSFVYMHLSMPHDPWFYDKNGRLRTEKEIVNDSRGNGRNPAAYLDYLQYANRQVELLVDTIQQRTSGQAVVILMGDHGFRQYILENRPENFRPINAVYLPDRKYGTFYDSISLVNQFPVLFNTLFDAHFPLLKDSAIFLPGDQPSIH